MILSGGSSLVRTRSSGVSANTRTDEDPGRGTSGLRIANRGSGAWQEPRPRGRYRRTSLATNRRPSESRMPIS
jgi:hypothetical protein